MPRAKKSGSGGPRSGADQTAYANRSDLNGQPEPITTVPGQPYGAAAEQRAAQRAVPIQGTQTPDVPNLKEPTVNSAQQPQPQAGPFAGELPWTGPTQRPNEPVTAGLPTGAGPGPEAMVGVGSLGAAHRDVRDLLANLASLPGATPDVKALAAYAQSGKG
jgi:hypothetical protein